MERGQVTVLRQQDPEGQDKNCPLFRLHQDHSKVLQEVH